MSLPSYRVSCRALFLASFALAACTSETEPSTIILTLPSSATEVTQGGTKSVAFQAERKNTADVEFSFADVPAGVSASVRKGTGSEADYFLDLSATAKATAGSATIKVTAKNHDNTVTSSGTLQVTVLVRGSYTLSAPETTSVSRGSTGSTSITLERVDGFAQDVALEVGGLPSGVTAAFSTTTFADSTTSSSLTFTANGSATLGTQAVTVTATSPSAPTKTRTINLVVQPTPEIALSLASASGSVEQGSSRSVAVTVARTNYAGSVALTASGAPAGVTVSFSPATLTGSKSTSTMTITATSAAASGSSTITVKAAGTGIVEKTAAYSATVTLATITLDFCASAPAKWFAYQNDGAEWKSVTPDANGTVSFSASSKLGVAVTRNFGSSLGLPSSTAVFTSILYLTAAELRALSGTCFDATGSRDFTVPATGIASNESWWASVGPSGNGPNNVATINFKRKADVGSFDIVGARLEGAPSAISSEFIPKAFMIRRGVDVTAGGSLPQIDFSGPEMVAAESYTFSLSGMGTSGGSMVMDFMTHASGDGPMTYQFTQTRSLSAATGTFKAVPSALTTTTDRHELTFTTTSAGSTLRVSSVFQNGSNQSLSFGPALNSPTAATVAAGRLRVQLASQAEYGGMVRFDFAQGTSLPTFTIEATAGYLGGTPTIWDLTMPDFSAVAGWDAGWNLTTGSSLKIAAEAYNLAHAYFPPAWVNTKPYIRPLASGSVLLSAYRQITTTVP